MQKGAVFNWDIKENIMAWSATMSIVIFTGCIFVAVLVSWFLWTALSSTSNDGDPFTLSVIKITQLHPPSQVCTSLSVPESKLSDAVTHTLWKILLHIRINLASALLEYVTI